MDRNVKLSLISELSILSLSARRAWIEMHGGAIGIKYLQLVALRKESVDRNKQRGIDENSGVPVALRKESVDRNGLVDLVHVHALASLSARRAWIEI